MDFINQHMYSKMEQVTFIYRGGKEWHVYLRGKKNLPQRYKRQGTPTMTWILYRYNDLAAALLSLHIYVWHVAVDDIQI